MIFTKSAFSKKVRKNMDLGFIFGGQSKEISIQHRFQKLFVFRYQFLIVFFGSEVYFGFQKFMKNNDFLKKIEVRKHPTKHHCLGAVFWMGLEAVSIQFWWIFGLPNVA